MKDHIIEVYFTRNLLRKATEILHIYMLTDINSKLKYLPYLQINR